MSANALKFFLPDRPVPMRIWRGPFRGARIVMNPRHSLRKAFGLYERELNPWLDSALYRVSRVLDVGANDGYFTFGCAAAFRRLGKAGEIVAFEPQAGHVQMLRDSVAAQGLADIRFEIVQSLVGREVRDGLTTLDALPANDRRNTLVKIDVEGAEVDVIAGASSWIDASNLFVIEVHKHDYLDRIIRMFDERHVPLKLIEHITGGFLGGDPWRSDENWWLVTNLAQTSPERSFGG